MISRVITDFSIAGLVLQLGKLYSLVEVFSYYSPYAIPKLVLCRDHDQHPALLVPHVQQSFDLVTAGFERNYALVIW